MKHTHIRQAVETVIVPPTNTKDTRVKASAERGKIIVAYDHELNSDENHIAAAKALVAKFIAEDSQRYQSKPESNPWARPFVSGGLSRHTVAHVFIEREGCK